MRRAERDDGIFETKREGGREREEEGDGQEGISTSSTFLFLFFLVSGKGGGEENVLKEKEGKIKEGRGRRGGREGGGREGNLQGETRMITVCINIASLTCRW